MQGQITKTKSLIVFATLYSSTWTTANGRMQLWEQVKPLLPSASCMAGSVFLALELAPSLSTHTQYATPNQTYDACCHHFVAKTKLQMNRNA